MPLTSSLTHSLTGTAPRLCAEAVACALLLGCRGPSGPRRPAVEAEDPHTTVYLSEEEALRVVFPDAARAVKERIALDAAERRAVEDVLGARLDQGTFTVYAGISREGQLDGYAVIQAEIGKFEPFHFIVGVEPDGRVRRVAVLVYRESRGGEVAHRRFLVQYGGKSASDPIRTSRDIINISGATMSVTALNRGVKKVLAVIEALYRRRPERLQRLLARGTESRLAAGAGPGAGSEGFAEAGRGPPREPPIEVREARQAMGAICEIRAWGGSRERLRRAIAAAFLEIEEAERRLSDYRPESELSTLSREAGGDAMPVSDLTAAFLREAGHIAARSGGAFDITVGPLVAAWGFRGGKPPSREPSAAELEALRPLLGHEKVLAARGEDGRWRARLARRGMKLDPGGLGKGFAVDLAGRSLLEAGVRSALIDFSGNMLALGAPPGLDAWEVAVRDPARPGSILGRVSLHDAAIASSGSYEKSVEIGGVRHGHILSPVDLRPVVGVHGSVVVAPTAASADGCSTAAHVLGRGAVVFLEDEEGVEGAVSIAGEDGPRILATKGWGRVFRAEDPVMPALSILQGGGE